MLRDNERMSEDGADACQHWKGPASLGVLSTLQWTAGITPTMAPSVRSSLCLPGGVSCGRDEDSKEGPKFPGRQGVGPGATALP